MTYHRQIKPKGETDMTTGLKPIESSIKVNEKEKMITVYSEKVWNTILETKEVKGHKVATIADNSMKTEDSYLVISHFTRREKPKPTKPDTTGTPAKAGQASTATDVPKIREARIQEVISGDAYITVKGDNATFRLVEIPTVVLDVALLLRDGNKEIVVEVDKARKDYFTNYVRGYATMKVKSYTRNCGLAGKENIDKAINLILTSK